MTTTENDPVSNCGTLYVVATPIGNLGDLSPRAIQTLREVDLILAEDTRKFKRLANQFEINTPVKSYYEYNEIVRTSEIISILKEGKNIALTSEAGTPTISDPGYRLLNACHNNLIKVSPIPGPCAAIAALSVSGFELDHFCFAGFLPPKEGRKRSELTKALQSCMTTVFYESPHRIEKSLRLLSELAPECDVFVARELTKMYEDYFRGTALSAVEKFAKKQTQRGEFILIIRRIDGKPRNGS